MNELKYHYVYRISSLEFNKHYYGVRTTNSIPKEDLGIKYFSSSHDTDFMEDQKSNPHMYKYKVVKIFCSRLEAAKFEILLHNKFDVGSNPSFYNKAKQTSVGFDVTGVPKNEATRKRLSDAHKGKKLSSDHKLKMSESHKGLKQSKTTVDKRRASYSGSKVYNAKIANVYNYYTDELIACSIVVNTWAKTHNYNQGNLAATSRCDRSIPSSSTNRHHHKGVYIEYLGDFNED